MSASTRIPELARLIADARILREKQEGTEEQRVGREFLLKISGATEADVAEHALRDPMTWIAAIVAYLEETL